MTTDRVLRTLAVLALTLPLTALADQARTRSWVSVRAGPGGNYPLVMKLAPGSFVQVNGCTHRYRWCDVIASDGQRGWAQGGSLYYLYQNGEVPVMSYGPSFGVPIVTFAMSDYWGSYYRGYPWYGHRQYWGPSYGYYGPAYGPGYGPGYVHGPGYVPRPGYVPAPVYVPGPGHVPRPPHHGPGVGLPGAPGLPRPPRLPHPPGLPGLP